jgi:putative membrane protein
MFNLIMRLLIAALAVFLAPNYLNQISVANFKVALIVAVVMALLNTFIKPILVFLSIPITFLTLGLFYFVINVGIVYLCARLVDGFKVQGFLQPLIFSFGLSLANAIAGWFQSED